MTPEQYVELHARVVRLRIESVAHYDSRTLKDITNFERLNYGELQAAPCGREDEIYATAKSQGKIIIAVARWNVRQAIYFKYRPEVVDGYIRKEVGAVFVGNDYNEILERVLNHLKAQEDIIVGGPDDPRNEGGLGLYTPA